MRYLYLYEVERVVRWFNSPALPAASASILEQDIEPQIAPDEKIKKNKKTFTVHIMINTLKSCSVWTKKKLILLTECYL